MEGSEDESILVIPGSQTVTPVISMDHLLLSPPIEPLNPKPSIESHLPADCTTPKSQTRIQDPYALTLNLKSLGAMGLGFRF